MTTLIHARARLRKHRSHALRIAKRHPKLAQRLRAEGRARAYETAIEWIDLALGDLKVRTV